MKDYPLAKQFRNKPQSSDKPESDCLRMISCSKHSYPQFSCCIVLIFFLSFKTLDRGMGGMKTGGVCRVPEGLRKVCFV